MDELLSAYNEDEPEQQTSVQPTSEQLQSPTNVNVEPPNKKQKTGRFTYHKKNAIIVSRPYISKKEKQLLQEQEHSMHDHNKITDHISFEFSTIPARLKRVLTKYVIIPDTLKNEPSTSTTTQINQTTIKKNSIEPIPVTSDSLSSTISSINTNDGNINVNNDNILSNSLELLPTTTSNINAIGNNSTSIIESYPSQMMRIAFSAAGRLRHTTDYNSLPKKLSFNLRGHCAGVNCLRYCSPIGHVLASASMDQTIKLWSLFDNQASEAAQISNSHANRCLRTIEGHTGGIKELQFTRDGDKMISGGFDKTVRLVDTETGALVQVFRHSEYVTALRFNPKNNDLFLSGGYRSGILCWDIRSNSIVKEYRGFLGQVQDLEFMADSMSFISSSDITKRNSTDKAIMVWEFDTSVVLSNQVYQEAFTCPCLRLHPSGAHFVAQSNGNYIAIFSTKSPYKLNKRKRYEGHLVSGYRIQCNFSPDGQYVVTGGADGTIYFYDYYSSKILKIIQAHEKVCTDVVYHPILSSMVASCSWDNVISIYE